jgi:organic radical activating enzyme
MLYSRCTFVLVYFKFSNIFTFLKNRPLKYSMRRTKGYKRSKLAKEEIYKMIDSAAEQNIQALSFTGGEPFIYKDELIDLIKYASCIGIPLKWKSMKDSEYVRLWEQDIKYYNQCDYFNGRKAK